MSSNYPLDKDIVSHGPLEGAPKSRTYAVILGLILFFTMVFLFASRDSGETLNPFGNGHPAQTMNNDCPTMCPAVYQPVCGTNGITYSNACQLSVDKCKSGNTSLEVAKPGPCGGSDAPDDEHSNGDSAEALRKPFHRNRPTI